MLVLDDDDVLRLLRSKVQRAGGLSAYSRRVGLDRAHVYRTLKRELGLAGRVLDALDLRVVYTSKHRTLRTRRTSPASPPWIEVVRSAADLNASRPKMVVFINGRQAKASQSGAALLACLLENLGRAAPFRLLFQSLNFRPSTNAERSRRHVLRQHIRMVKQMLKSHKAPYVVAVIPEVGYALCEADEPPHAAAGVQPLIDTREHPAHLNSGPR